MSGKYNNHSFERYETPRKYSTPPQGYQQQGWTAPSATQAFFSEQSQPQVQFPVSKEKHPQYEPYTDEQLRYKQHNPNWNSPSPYPQYPGQPRYSPAPDQEPIYPSRYEQYERNARPPRRDDDRGLMGAIGGGVAGMAGGEMLGGHPILGAIAGAVIGDKMEKRHKRHKHEREELAWEEQRVDQGYDRGYY